MALKVKLAERSLVVHEKLAHDIVHILLPFSSFLKKTAKTALSTSFLVLLLKASKCCTACRNVIGFWTHWLKRSISQHLLKANSWPSLTIWQPPGAQQ